MNKKYGNYTKEAYEESNTILNEMLLRKEIIKEKVNTEITMEVSKINLKTKETTERCFYFWIENVQYYYDKYKDLLIIGKEDVKKYTEKMGEI